MLPPPKHTETRDSARRLKDPGPGRWEMWRNHKRECDSGKPPCLPLSTYRGREGKEGYTMEYAVQGNFKFSCPPALLGQLQSCHLRIEGEKILLSPCIIVESRTTRNASMNYLPSTIPLVPRPASPFFPPSPSPSPPQIANL
ncbi:hypothetical protein IF2G_08634 [Cordyceps javanica]|nr:hypothetical protein IF2G_08634 [Cordyceps javanica]